VNVVKCENHARFGQYLTENLLFVRAFHLRRLLFVSYTVLAGIVVIHAGLFTLKIFVSVFFILLPFPGGFHTYIIGEGCNTRQKRCDLHAA
jgi:hypothetical protein